MKEAGSPYTLVGSIKQHPVPFHETAVHVQHREHIKSGLICNVLINSVSDCSVNGFIIPNIVLMSDYLSMALQPLWILAAFSLS
jgi:hypothetical protein